MGAGCAKDKSAEPPQAQPARAKSATLKKSASGNGSRKTRDDLAAQFVAEFPADDDPDEVPAYPDGSREATLLKIFSLLDKESVGYIDIPVWKEYALGAGLTTEALAKELAVIIAQRGDTPGDPQVSARQFVTATARMVADKDDQAFGRFVAQTLIAHRTKGASRYMTPEQIKEMEEEQGQVASQA